MTTKNIGEYGKNSFLKLGWVGVVNLEQSQQWKSGGKQKFRLIIIIQYILIFIPCF